ncbi:uncharacterized protein EV154DRAFT_514338 [Mucor mucedo]|uniref:uncharacterized protein n=1 Tax=Mucor mucedo TaxID=29922 RepID=UPI002220EE8A|nr:uncharacterized protein EV154DRAFT_514338 [Mucor mucedo]KAI7889472.1 hypothetical protein EV154DRAFT_514338 [Mucor mucedo]
MEGPPTPANDQQETTQRPQMNRSSLYMLLFLFSLLFFNFSDDGTVRNGKPTKADLLEELQLEKEILNNLTFGVNVSHPLPKSVLEPLKNLRAIHESSSSVYYHNITGIFRGNWENRNISVPDNANKTALDEARSKFKFEGPGSFSINLKATETMNKDINYMEGYVRIKDHEKSDYGALLLAGGVHFLGNGSLFLMVVPDGNPIPLEDLLHMLPTNKTLVAAREVIDEQIDKRIDELEREKYWDWQPSDESSDRSNSVPFTCNFQMFAQLHPVPSSIKESELLEFERELEHPLGVSTIYPPALLMSSEMFSPNCNLLLSSHKQAGIKIESYYNKAITYAGIASVIAVIQIFSLIHQMEYTPTPSSVSNVSYWTISMQAVMDGYLCLLFLTTGVVIENVFIPFATAAFFTFVLVSIFGMRYLLVVWRIQRPESVRPSTPPSPVPDSNRTPDTENLLPVANVRRPNTNEESNPQRDITYLYYRLYAVLLLGLFLFYQSVTRSALVQNIIVGSLGFLFYSFWVPQIVRNVFRGCRHPLSHRYIAVMSITRLSVPLYFYGCPNNLVGHETTLWVWALVAYIGLQVVILLLQDAFGPRFFVPSKYLPQTYNYHPIISTDDEEAIQEGDENGDAKSLHQSRDCAICMLPIDISHGKHTGLNVLSRTTYMITPCHHMFHTECLERWMRIKLECPVCRAYLPAC